MDRVGEVWEFSDGMIILVVASNQHRGNDTSHDALVLRDGDEDSYESAGAFSPGWLETESMWTSLTEERWRIA